MVFLVEVDVNLSGSLVILKGWKLSPGRISYGTPSFSPSVAFISGRALRAPHDFSCEEESRRASLTLISLLLRS